MTVARGGAFRVQVLLPPPPGGFAPGSDLGSYDVVTSKWTPGRATNGLVTQASIDALPSSTWIEVVGSDMMSNVQPALAAGGYTIYQAGSDGVGATLTNYNGMAWDHPTGRGWAHGGGHNGGSDNRVDELSLYKMKWTTIAWPQKVGVNGWTAEHDDFYRKSTGYGVGGGLLYARKFSLASSPTGFAVPSTNSFSAPYYKAVAGPAGLFASQAELDAAVAGPDRTLGEIVYDPDDFAPYDVMPDGTPATRHTYHGFLYDAPRQQLIMATRAYWRCKTDGSGWIKYADGGRTKQISSRGHSECVWAHVDEVTGKVYTGGCGSDCWQTSYFYYSNCRVFDPSTLVETDGPGLIPPGGANLTYCHSNLAFKAGRWIGGFDWPYNSGLPAAASYGWMFNLDDSSRRFVFPTGEVPISADGYNRISAVYLPHRGKLWCYDFRAPQSGAWEIDIDSPQAGGPDGSQTVACRLLTEVLRADILGSSDLAYTKFTFWPQERLLVFVHTDATRGVFICKVP